MAVALAFFCLIGFCALASYLMGLIFRIPVLFIIGNVLFLGCGAILWAGDGLELSKTLASVSDDGTLNYTVNSIAMSDVGLNALALLLVSIGVISFLVIDFRGSVQRSASPFHY
jgi:hypothetical protein